MPLDKMVDPKSYDLAEHFLQDDDEAGLSLQERAARRLSLAQAIQEAVEEWVQDDEDGRASWQH